mmetsp:Transcript_26753/g.61931  ORF Transcript_26753/g.61931 Transcript_26753/m.61931 type:complete len:245 (-) Transcript_26753:143-877(-)
MPCGGPCLRGRRSVRVWLVEDPFVHLVDARLAAEGHGQVKLLVNHLEAQPHTVFTVCTQTIQPGSSNHCTLCPQRQCFQHRLPAANSAVNPNLNLVPHRSHNLWQHLHSRRRAVELPPSMVGDDDCVCAALYGDPGVLHIHDALEDQLAPPLLLDPLDVGPRQPGVKLLLRPGRQRRHVVDTLCVPHDVSEGEALGPQHPKTPLGLGAEVQEALQSRAWGCGETILDVGVALPQHLQVECQDER